VFPGKCTVRVFTYEECVKEVEYSLQYQSWYGNPGNIVNLTFPGFEKILQIEIVNQLQVSTKLVVCKSVCWVLEMQWQQDSSLNELYFFFPSSFQFLSFLLLSFLFTLFWLIFLRQRLNHYVNMMLEIILCVSYT